MKATRLKLVNAIDKMNHHRSKMRPRLSILIDFPILRYVQREDVERMSHEVST